MYVLDYTRSLINSIVKNDVEDQLENDIAILTNKTKPTLSEMSEMSSKGYLKSPELVSLKKVIHQRLTFKPNRNLFDTVNGALPNIELNAQALKDVVKKEFNGRILTQALTIRQSNVLVLCEMLTFFNDYTSRAANYALKTSFNAAVKAKAISIPKYEYKYIDDNDRNYARAISLLNVKKKEFIKLIDSLPEVIVDEHNAEIVSGVHAGRTPLSGTAEGFVGSPIYHVGMAIATWQATRLRRLDEDRSQLKLLVASLKTKLDEEGRNANIEKLIEIHQERIEELDYKLRDLEEL